MANVANIREYVGTASGNQNFFHELRRVNSQAALALEQDQSEQTILQALGDLPGAVISLILGFASTTAGVAASLAGIVIGLAGNEREAHRQILALGAGAADEVSELLLQNDNYVSAVVEFIFIEYTLVYDDASEEVLTLVYGSQYEIISIQTDDGGIITSEELEE